MEKEIYSEKVNKNKLKSYMERKEIDKENMKLQLTYGTDTCRGLSKALRFLLLSFPLSF